MGETEFREETVVSDAKMVELSFEAVLNRLKGESRVLRHVICTVF